jgi:hypothetical protein
MHFELVIHLESNSPVERAKGIILFGISKSLVGFLKEKWSDELIKVVWSCFSLFYSLGRPKTRQHNYIKLHLHPLLYLSRRIEKMKEEDL